MKKINHNLLVSIFFICILILICFENSCTKLQIGDLLWNFQNVYKMYQGGIIYSDTNVIICPIFYEISYLLFCLLGANVFVFKIYNIIIFSFKFLLIYIIFRKLNFKKTLSILYLSLWYVIDVSNIFSGANYNQLALVFVLAGILLFFDKYNNKYYHLWQGFIIYLVFFTKQTIGIYYGFGLVLFELITIGFNKKFFKNQLLKLVTFLPCIIASLLIMYFRGNLYDFVNLCFGGIFEFGNSNFSFAFKNAKYFLYIAFVIIFTILVLKNKNTNKELKTNIIFLLCISLALTFNMYPLVNQYHSIMSMNFYFILFVYMLDRLMIDEIFNGKKQEIFCSILSFVMLFLILIRIAVMYFDEIYKLDSYEKTSPFYGLKISTKDTKHINIVTSYIKLRQSEGIRVIFLTPDAFAYMIPLGLNNNEFDLLFCGNLGYNGIQKTIDKISKMKNTEFVIFTDEDECFYQESKEIREYILNNLEKKDELLNYSIYINP